MNPNTAQNDIERWRKQDAGIRRALQQRYADQPELPKGFEERMRQRLAEETAKPKQRTLWIRYAAAAAMIAIVAGVTTLWWPDEQAQLAMVDEQPTIKPSSQTDTKESIDEQQLPVAPPQPASDQQQQVVKSDAHEAVSSSSPKVEPTATVSPESIQEADRPAMSSQVLAAVTDQPQEDLLSETNAEETPPAKTSTYAEPVESTMPDRLTTVRPSRIPPTIKSKSTSTRSSHLLTIQTYMGADGGDLGMDHLAMADADHFVPQVDEESHPTMTKPANYYFPMGNGYTYDFGYYADADLASKVNSMPIKNPVKEEKISSTKHQLPVTVGATLQWYLSDHWAIETGLTYTRLLSTFDTGVTSTYHHREQHIHYLGIPVRVHAQLLEHKRWHLYAAAGISTELPVAASVATQTITLAQRTDAVKEHISAPVQFAPSLGAGVSFDITPAIGLYAEPSAQWFIPTNSDVETYRTEHPLRFIPQVGLRWNVKR